MAKISNKIKIKNVDGTFEDIQISYIGPNGTWAEGEETVASGKNSHAEGYKTIASGDWSHAEGGMNVDRVGSTASGDWSHAEGSGTTASGSPSHAEGDFTEASGYASHAEGSATIASGACSHAEGDHTEASGTASHAEGRNTIATGSYQHVQGKYNVEDADGAYVHIVGNGTSSARSNAHTLDWDGNAWFAGNVTIGKEKKKLVCVDDIYPVGSVYITSTNENPATYLGGNWKLVEKNLKEKIYDSRSVPIIFETTLNCQSAIAFVYIKGRQIRIQIQCVVGSTSVGETDGLLFRMDFSQMGFSKLAWTNRSIGASDNGNGIAFLSLDYDMGYVSWLDALSKNDNVITEGNTIVAEFDGVISLTGINDTFCDKFYWKKYETFTFKIGDISYEAETGMTWAEWVNTEYNTNGVTISGDAVVPPIGVGYIWDEQYTATEHKNNLIIKDSNYIID